MSSRRRIADFFIKTCGVRKLHGTNILQFMRAVFDEIDLQFVRDSSPCQSFRDRTEMYRYINESCIGDKAVDYLEFGVFRGDSMRQWATLNNHPESRFFGFDSFEGLPEDWRMGQARGHFDVGGVMPRIDDPRVRFVKGWFETTIPNFVGSFTTNNRLLLHLDADLYRSTMLPLVYFTPFMSKGTLLIFDEFYDRNHEFKALIDWRRLSGWNFRIVAEMENYGRVCAQLL